MKAVLVDTNAPGHLVLGDTPDPSPLPSQALVRIHAVSLNRGEVQMTRRPRPNWRPGWDLAGVVTTQAADGSGPPAGTRVVGLVQSGAWAESAAVGTDALASLPDEVSFEDAATLPVAGLTAYHALYKGGLLLGKTVLVTGATGGVGDFAIKLGKMSGANVVAHVRRAEQASQVSEAGADRVAVGESLADAAQGMGPFDLIIESVGGPVLGDALGLVSEGTKVVSFGTSAGNPVTFDAQAFYGAGLTALYGSVLVDELRTVESASLGLKRLASLVSAGSLKPFISRVAPWADVAAVAQELLDRKYAGKAVLRLD